MHGDAVHQAGLLGHQELCAWRCAGQPHLGVDVDQIEPPAVVAAAAAGLFALGKPLTGSRSLPKVNLDEQYDNVGRIGRVIATVSLPCSLHASLLAYEHGWQDTVLLHATDV